MQLLFSFPVIAVHISHFTFMDLADTFIQSDLQVLHVFVSMCVLWELNPQPLYC